MIDRRARIRWTEWTIIGLAVLAALWGIVLKIALPQASQGFIHAATAPAFIIVVLTAVHMWARRTDVLWSSRYLALFSAVLAAFIAISGFVMRETPAYAWGELIIGGLLFAVTLFEAWVSWPSSESQLLSRTRRAREG
jgi:peptidoglycan/LPS O-acetylase OafA/YrhL